MENINSQEKNNEQMVSVAMQIILHAGESRVLADKAFISAKESNFNKAYELMEMANSELLKAHRSQTDVIQDETRGIRHEHSLLFAHAQDHLMTIMSEIKTTKKLIELYELIINK